MDRLKTYVEGFDEALGGGIPRGSIVLVAGTPGTMKTALTFSILYENVKAGSKALYISLEESQEDLRASMSELGMTGLEAMELTSSTSERSASSIATRSCRRTGWTSSRSTSTSASG